MRKDRIDHHLTFDSYDFKLSAMRNRKVIEHTVTHYAVEGDLEPHYEPHHNFGKNVVYAGSALLCLLGVIASPWPNVDLALFSLFWAIAPMFFFGLFLRKRSDRPDNRIERIARESTRILLSREIGITTDADPVIQPGLMSILVGLTGLLQFFAIGMGSSVEPLAQEFMSWYFPWITLGGIIPGGDVPIQQASFWDGGWWGGGLTAAVYLLYFKVIRTAELEVSEDIEKQEQAQWDDSGHVLIEHHGFFNLGANREFAAWREQVQHPEFRANHVKRMAIQTLQKSRMINDPEAWREHTWEKGYWSRITRPNKNGLGVEWISLNFRGEEHSSGHQSWRERRLQLIEQYQRHAQKSLDREGVAWKHPYEKDFSWEERPSSLVVLSGKELGF